MMAATRENMARSTWTPGYIKFFYLFLLLGIGALINDYVCEALTPSRPEVAWRPPAETAPPLVPVADLDIYVPPQWRAEQSRRRPAAFLPGIPAGAKNPFAACESVATPQKPTTDANTLAFLRGIRDNLAKTSGEQLRLLEGMRDCARAFAACRPGKIKDETTKIKKQIEQNITRLRVYMALMENRVDAFHYHSWSDHDAAGMPTFTMKTIEDAMKDGGPFKNPVIEHLVGTFADNEALERLTPRELKQALEIFNKDAASIMKSFKAEPGRRDERGARIAFFGNQSDEIKKFYKSKYAVLLGRFPTLAFYGQSAYRDEALAASLETIRAKADSFQSNTLPANARGWGDLRHLVMNESVVEAALETDPSNCEIAHKLQLALKQADDFKAFFKKWRGWGVFGLVTACVVASGGTLAVICGGGGILASSAFLYDDYLILDSEAADLITNVKKADPKKILEIWARTKKFKVNVVIHVIGVATFAGIIPISTTDPLRNAVQEILKTSTEPIATHLLIERLAVKLQGVVEAHIIEGLVNSWTAIEKDLAADKTDLQYYHQFVKKIRKS